MTLELDGAELARRINEALPGAATEWNGADVWVEPESLLDVARFLKDTPDLDFSTLTRNNRR